jgi:hypothetical protein
MFKKIVNKIRGVPPRNTRGLKNFMEAIKMNSVLNNTRLFKQGRNPYHRICKKCGAHQDLFCDGYKAEWWEEVYPIGNNPDCDCHKQAEYR